MKGFLIALQFLTRIPVRIKGLLTEREIGRSALFFPLVGLLQGIVIAAATIPFTILFAPRIAGGLLVALLFLTNGGFHLDGLADTADALSVKATGDPPRDREKRLAVMKDPHAGTIGVAAITLVLLLKYLFMESLLEKGLTWDVLFVVLITPVFSKWAMVPVIYHGMAAREEGLGKLFADHVDQGVLLLSAVILASIFFGGVSLIPEKSWPTMIKLFLITSALFYALSFLWTRVCKARFGGLTGDTIGAVSEAGDILVLAVGVIWL